MDAQIRLEKLEAKLKESYERGGERNEYVGGFGGGHLHASSAKEVEDHEEERTKLAAAVKKARAEAQAERRKLKEHAGTSNDPSSWTKKLLDGDGRFDVAEEGNDRLVVQATYGLRTHEEFKGTKARVEEEQRESAIREAEERKAAAAAEEAAAARRREAKKKRKRQQEASKLSFEDEDE